jgi:hypothetical protein
MVKILKEKLSQHLPEETNKKPKIASGQVVPPAHKSTALL